MVYCSSNRPCALTTTSSLNVNNQLYLYGGTDKPTANVCLPGLYAYDIGLRTWQYIQTYGTSPPTLSHSMSRIGTMIFVFGGIVQGAVVNKVSMLHIRSNTWSYLRTSGEPPSPRCDHAAAVVGDHLYIHGGCGGVGIWYSDLYSLDTVTLSWSKPELCGASPYARANHTLIAHQKTLYVFGGCNDSLKGPRSVFGDLFALNLDKTDKGKWEVLSTSQQHGRHSHGAHVVHGELYIFGGMNYRTELGDLCILKLPRKTLSATRFGDINRRNTMKQAGPASSLSRPDIIKRAQCGRHKISEEEEEEEEGESGSRASLEMNITPVTVIHNTKCSPRNGFRRKSARRSDAAFS